MRILNQPLWQDEYARHLRYRQSGAHAGNRLDLSFSVLEKIDLSGCDLSDLVCDQTIFEACTGTAPDFANTRFRRSTFRACCFENADFAASIWHESVLESCTLTGGFWMGVEMQDCQIIGGIWRDLDWRGARLHNPQTRGGCFINNQNLPELLAGGG